MSEFVAYAAAYFLARQGIACVDSSFADNLPNPLRLAPGITQDEYDKMCEYIRLTRSDRAALGARFAAGEEHKVNLGWSIHLFKEPDDIDKDIRVITIYPYGDQFNPNPKWAIEHPKFQVRIRGGPGRRPGDTGTYLQDLAGQAGSRMALREGQDNFEEAYAMACLIKDALLGLPSQDAPNRNWYGLHPTHTGGQWPQYPPTRADYKANPTWPTWDRWVSVIMIGGVNSLGPDEEWRPWFTLNFRVILEPDGAVGDDFPVNAMGDELRPPYRLPLGYTA